MAERRSVIAGVGSYLPARIMSNDDLSRIVDTSDEWIVERTGITRAPDRGRRRNDRRPRDPRRPRALDDAGMTAGRDRPHHRSRPRRPTTPFRPPPPRCRPTLASPGRGLRFAGGVLGLRLRPDRGRQPDQDQASECALVIGAGDLLAHPRLDRPLNLRALRRWRRRGGAVGRSMRLATMASAASSRPACAPTGATRQALCRWRTSTTMTVGHLRMEGREVFKHAVINIAAVMRETMEEAGVTARRYRLVRAPSGQPAHPRGDGRKLGIREDRIVMTLDVTAIPRQPRFRWRSMKRSRTAASSAATLCSWRPWAAALPGVRYCFGGEDSSLGLSY